MLRKSSYRGLAGVLAAGALAYANSLPGALFWDNEALILNNLFLRSFRFLPLIFSTSVMAGGGEATNYYRPVPVALLLCAYQLWGPAPWGYHALNILLHLANTGLVFFLGKRVLRSTPAALAASLLFVLHPVNNEAVNYADHVEGLLALAFGLGTLLAEAGGRRALSLACWVLCLLSKEEGLVFLPLLAAFKIVTEGRSLRTASLTLLPHAAIGAAYLYAHLTVFNFLHLPLTGFGAQRGAFGELPLRLLTFSKALLTYFRLLAWPTGLHFDRELVPAASWRDLWAWSAALADGAIMTLWWAASSSPPSRLGLLWFLTGLLPYCGLVPFNNLLAEHFLYIPAVGVFLAAADWGRRQRLLSRGALTAALGALAGFYAAQDFLRNRDWQDPVRIYLTTLAGNPRSYRAANNLGVEEFRAGKMEAAKERFLSALGVKSDYAPALNNLGAVEEAQGREDSALFWYRRAASADPGYSVAWKNQAGILLDARRFPEAEAAARRALALFPQYPEALQTLGAALFELGRTREAREALAQALALKPTPQLRRNLAIVDAALARNRP